MFWLNIYHRNIKIKKLDWLLAVTAFIVVTVFFFWKFFIKGLLPIPADIMTGSYFPWFDLKFSSYPAGIPVKNPALSDVVSIIYPWRKLAVDLLKQGTAPLWNPYILSGTPLLANFQSVALYPLNLIYLFMPFDKGWSLQVILQPLLASIFMYIFLRDNNFKRSISIFGSVAWGFNGFFLVWLEYNTIVHAALYFPLMLLFLHRSQHKKVNYLYFAVTTSFSLYAGYPQITAYLLLFCALYFLFIYGRKALKQFPFFLLTTLLGFGLTSPLLIPGFETSRLSIRSVDKVADASHVKFVPLGNIITFIAPDYFGNPTTANFWPKLVTYENTVIYPGATVFVMFLLSFLFKDNKHKNLKNFALISFLLSFIFVFNNHFSRMVGQIPFLSSFVMTRLTVIMIFAMITLSCIAMEKIYQKGISIKNFIVGLFLIIALFFGAFVNSKYIISGIEQNVSLRNLILPGILTVITFASLYLFRGKRLITILIIVLILDLYRFHDKYNPFVYAEILYPKSQITEFLGNQGDVRFDVEKSLNMPPNMWMPYKIYSASGQDAAHPLRYNEFLNFVNKERFNASDRYAEIDNVTSPLVDFLGIKYFVVTKWKNASPDFDGKVSYKFKENLISNNGKFREVFNNDRNIILENQNSYPLIYSVSKYKVAKSKEDFQALLLNEDLSKTVILEEDLHKVFNENKFDLNHFEMNPGKIVATFKLNEDGIVTLSQNYFPGWKAYIDGKETKIYRANYTFMAIESPKGKHYLELVYKPTSFKYGILIGYFSFVIVIISLLYFRGRKQHVP